MCKEDTQYLAEIQILLALWMAEKSLWCHSNGTYWKLVLENYEIFPLQYWELFMGRCLTRSMLLQNHPWRVLRKAAGCCAPQEPNSGGEGWMCFRSPALGEPPALCELGPEEAACIAGTWKVISQNQEETPFHGSKSC